MSEALSDGLTSLRDHLPTASAARDAVSSVKGSRDAMLEHLPSRDDIDVSAIRGRLPGDKPGKRGLLLAVVLGLVAAAGAFAVSRRKRAAAPVSPSIYTPPLPKP